VIVIKRCKKWAYLPLPLNVKSDNCFSLKMATDNCIDFDREYLWNR